MYRRLGLAVDLVLGAEVDHELQTLDIHALRIPAAKKVREVTLRLCVCIRNRALERGAGKAEHGLQADGGLLVLELVELAEGVWVDVQLEHVENLPLEEAHEGQTVGPLLAVVAEDHERCVVLFAEELERVGVLERVNIVLLVELDRERLLQLLEVRQRVLRDLAA